MLLPGPCVVPIWAVALQVSQDEDHLHVRELMCLLPWFRSIVFWAVSSFTNGVAPSSVAFSSFTCSHIDYRVSQQQGMAGTETSSSVKTSACTVWGHYIFKFKTKQQALKSMSLRGLNFRLQVFVKKSNFLVLGVYRILCTYGEENLSNTNKLSYVIISW